MKNLSKNNQIIDLSKEELYSGNEDIQEFNKDIEIINKAKCNINVGCGGSLSLCQCFSQNNLSFIGNTDHKVANVYKNTYKSIKSFIQSLQEYNN